MYCIATGASQACRKVRCGSKRLDGLHRVLETSCPKSDLGGYFLGLARWRGEYQERRPWAGVHTLLETRGGILETDRHRARFRTSQ